MAHSHKPPHHVSKDEPLRLRQVAGAIRSIEAPMVILEAPLPATMTIHTSTLISYVPLQGQMLSTESRLQELFLFGYPDPGDLPVKPHLLPPPRCRPIDSDNVCDDWPRSSIWHHIAVGSHPAEEIDSFLRSTREVDAPILERDLWEGTGLIEREQLMYFESPGTCRFNDWELIDRQRLFSFRTPLELCLIIKMGFLTPYAGRFDETCLRPEVWRLVRDSLLPW